MELALSRCLDVTYANDAHGLDLTQLVRFLHVFSVFSDWFMYAGCLDDAQERTREGTQPYRTRVHSVPLAVWLA